MTTREEIDFHADRVQEIGRRAHQTHDAREILRLSTEMKGEVRQMGEAVNRLKAERQEATAR